MDTIKILIMDYESNKHEYEIPDYSHLRGVHIRVESGDHIVTPVYEDGHFGETLDPMYGQRLMGFYDGEVFVEVGHIPQYNKLRSTYDLFSMGFINDDI